MLKKLTMEDLYEYGFLKTNFSEFDLTDMSNPAVQRLKEEVRNLIYNEKGLLYLKIPGLDLSDIPEEAFQDVIIEESDLKDCKARFNPQLLALEEVNGIHMERRLVGVNLEGNDLSGMDLKDINIKSANFTNTGAVINLAETGTCFLEETILSGCEIIGKPNNIFYGENTFPDEYKKENPEYFIGENSPEELKYAFYGADVWDDEIQDNVIIKYKSFLQDKNLIRFEKYSPIIRIINTIGWEKAEEIVHQYDDINKALTDIDLLRSLMEDDTHQFESTEPENIDEQEKNVFFSQLPKEKQGELIKLARHYKPSYKPRMGIHPKITFGKEIEFNGFDYSIMRKTLLENPVKFGFYEWKCMDDATVDGEVVSPPLYDSPMAWEQYQNVCNKIKGLGGFTDSKCGGHIHFGASALENSPQKWLQLFKIWSTFEDVIFRLSGGELEKIRGESYAQPVSLYLKQFVNGEWDINSEDDIKVLAQVYGQYADKTAHYQSLNLENILDGYGKQNYDKYTIEMRCFNGTLDPVQGQTNVLIGAGILGAAIDIVDDLENNRERAELLDKYYQESISQDYQYKEEGNIDKMLAFVDIVCTNKDDKLRLLNLWGRTKEVNLENQYNESDTKIKRRMEELSITGGR